MAFDFYMPDIGEGVVEGEIVAWKVKEGDRVKLDQPLVEVMTDKATVELPSPRAGTIAKIHYQDGQICPVGQARQRPRPPRSGAAPGHATRTRRARSRERPALDGDRPRIDPARRPHGAS